MIWWLIVGVSLAVIGAAVVVILLALGFAVCQESSRQRRSVIVPTLETSEWRCPLCGNPMAGWHHSSLRGCMPGVPPK